MTKTLGTAAASAADVELGDVLPALPEDHILVRFIRKKYKCIVVFMMFFICAQQVSNNLLQGLKVSPLTAENLNDVVKMILENKTVA